MNDIVTNSIIDNYKFAAKSWKRMYEEKKEEVERLNNIINGVEDLLKRFKCSYREIPIQIVLNEIRELKGSDKE